MRWAASVIAALLVTALVHGQGRPPDRLPNGYLLPGAGTGSLACPYQPRVGDILLFDELNRFYHFIYRLGRSQPPTHVAIVIAREDGSLALLDLLGPTVLGARVSIIDIPPRLHSYPGIVMVRRLREPITAEQSAGLTAFARAQEGKAFAVKRVALQATPFCARVGLRRYCFARTHFDRTRWFCSELVVAAAGAAQILDPRAFPANAIVPHELAFDARVDLSPWYEPPLPWVGAPPAHP